MNRDKSTIKNKEVIWEEKHSIEQQMKSENNAVSVATSSMQKIKNVSVKNECKNTGRKRNCPQCNREIVYALKSGRNRAHKNNALCNSCKVTGNRNPQFGLPNINRGVKFFAPEHYKKQNRDKAILYNYGITSHEYDSIKKSQNFQCRTCGMLETITQPLQLDHCHSSGKLRAFLCGRCNKALGLVSDNVKVLENLKQYLIEFIE